MKRLALLVLAACGGGGGGGHDWPDGGPHPDAGPEPTSLGEVYVLENTDHAFEDTGPERRMGGVSARVRTGADPLWQQVVDDDGTCRLLLLQPAQCDSFCDGVCTGRNVCTPYPTTIDVGTLHVEGLVGGDLALEPTALTNWYYQQYPMPANLFDDDTVVRMRATGSDDMPAFEAEVRATPTLEAEIEDHQITLVDTEDFVLRWTPAGDHDARVRLTLNANNSGHGAPYNGVIECEAYDDAQEIRVPKEMIARFPATENWSACAGSDCPRSWVRRYRRAYATVPGGGVRLELGSEIDFGVVHRQE